jgi:hypothetical protein
MQVRNISKISGLAVGIASVGADLDFSAHDAEHVTRAPLSVFHHRSSIVHRAASSVGGLRFIDLGADEAQAMRRTRNSSPVGD